MIKHALLAVLAGLTASACSLNYPAPESHGSSETGAGYHATVYRTQGGIPHIVADDWSGLGYGQGYASAQDHYCELARNILKFRAQLSANFGAGEGNLDSDLFYQLQINEGLYDVSIQPEFDSLFAGYAAGFNRYQHEHPAAEITDPACAGADWIVPMTADDVRRFNLTPAFLQGFAQLMVAASPPADKMGAALNGDEIVAAASLPAAIEQLPEKGSNGVAIGRDLSSDGSGLLFANPHLHWHGFDFRMYGMHHIIPGEYNMLGANQAQRANVGFGTNGHVAWTNTVSVAMDFTFYQLELVPDDPYAYRFDDEVRAIEAIRVSVEVLGEDGDLKPHHHTFYRSHQGWLVGGRLSWDKSHAYSMRIADEGVRGFEGGALAFATAKTVRDLKAANNRYQHTSGVNTIAADSSGEVLYGDLGPVVNLSDKQLQVCTLYGHVMRGDTSECEWNNAEDAAAPGLLGASDQPFLFRTDYVTNSNDSYWLANPTAPLTGFPRVQGDTHTERRMRTRAGLQMVAARQAGADGLSGNTFDQETLVSRMLSNENTAGQLLRDDLLALCKRQPEVELSGEFVDLRRACAVLAQWDLTANLDSRGAHVFREFIAAARVGSDRRGSLPAAFNVAQAFDGNDPVNTPAGLDREHNPQVLQALATAVVRLQDAGIALDARLGDIQGVTRKGEWIPLHGGDDMEGVFNKMSLELVDEKGYPEVTGSSGSWIQVTRVAEGDTRVKALATYSQSTDSSSPHYSDMTKRFSEKRLIEIPFLLKDVQAAAVSELVLEESREY